METPHFGFFCQFFFGSLVFVFVFVVVFRSYYKRTKYSTKLYAVVAETRRTWVPHFVCYTRHKLEASPLLVRVYEYDEGMREHHTVKGRVVSVTAVGGY